MPRPAAVLSPAPPRRALRSRTASARARSARRASPHAAIAFVFFSVMRFPVAALRAASGACSSS